MTFLGEDAIVIIAGPTASGKSALALDLAEQLEGCVINGDSMQVYGELRILTARPTPEEEARVPHDLYGFVPATENFSVGRWLEATVAAIARARAAGRLPIVVGGTGLYLKCLMEGLSPMPSLTDRQRETFRRRWRAMDTDDIRALLEDRDPDAAARIPRQDRQRMTRALEICEATGTPFSRWLADNPPRPPVQARFLPLLVMPPRAELYARCDARFAAMMAAGALDEVRSLAALDLNPDLPLMKALGVPPLLDYLAGKIDLETAESLAMRQTRNFAKRQCSWFRTQYRPAQTIDAQYSASLSAEILSFVRRFLLTP